MNLCFTSWGPPKKHHGFSLSLPQAKRVQHQTSQTKLNPTPHPPKKTHKKTHILFVGFCLPHPTPTGKNKTTTNKLATITTKQTTSRFRFRLGFPNQLQPFLLQNQTSIKVLNLALSIVSAWLVSRLVGWLV